MTIGIRGIAQVVVFVEEPAASARFWARLARERLLAAGCDPWRGQLEIEEGRTIGQVRDPFGTVWGLDGP